MAKRKIRLGLIGCGNNMRYAHVPRFKADRAVELAAVVDTAEPPARALMEAWGRDVPYYSDFKKMIRDERLDAVCVSSPHSEHYPQVRHVLANNLHALVEKPLTTRSSHARALIDLARRKRRALVVSYQRHFFRPYVYVRELIRRGAIGELRGVVSYVTQDWSAAGGWRLVPELSGGGMFMDTGSHLVAATLWMTGLQAVDVSAYLDMAGGNVDINLVTTVRFAGGALGTLNSFGNAAQHDERIAIHGSKGSIVFELYKFQVRSVQLNGAPLIVPARIKEDTPDASLLRWIRNGRKGYELPNFAVQVAKVSEAVYKSVEQKRLVRMAR